MGSFFIRYPNRQSSHIAGSDWPLALRRLGRLQPFPTQTLSRIQRPARPFVPFTLERMIVGDRRLFRRIEASPDMVPLPLFKLASLFVRHISKYGAVCRLAAFSLLSGRVYG